ncbi:MAG: hypothetical protein N3G22_02580 [Candidatus Micrarchaeota archaeon]|nr:hypothetical protein [Candidatus Micrarchaeota archaeon]
MCQCCCGCKSWLKLIFGALLILSGSGVLGFNPWVVLGILIALLGVSPMLCKCEECCAVPKKKK